MVAERRIPMSARYPPPAGPVLPGLEGAHVVDPVVVVIGQAGFCLSQVLPLQIHGRVVKALKRCRRCLSLSLSSTPAEAASPPGTLFPLDVGPVLVLRGYRISAAPSAARPARR